MIARYKSALYGIPVHTEARSNSRSHSNPVMSVCGHIIIGAVRMPSQQKSGLDHDVAIALNSIIN
jgi:hypothetical protein